MVMNVVMMVTMRMLKYWFSDVLGVLRTERWTNRQIYICIGIGMVVSVHYEWSFGIYCLLPYIDFLLLGCYIFPMKENHWWSSDIMECYPWLSGVYQLSEETCHYQCYVGRILHYYHWHQMCSLTTDPGHTTTTTIIIIILTIRSGCFDSEESAIQA